MKQHDKISEMVDRIIPELTSRLIYDTEDGNYVLFNEYVICKNNGQYQVFRYRDDNKFVFGSLRNATAWSILDWYNKIIESRRVLELDKLISSIKVDQLIHKKLQTKGNLENREINRDKLLHDLDKQNRFQHELDKYIIMAKTCQQKGFENELTRTSRK